MQKIDKENEKKFLEAENYRANKEFQKAINIFKTIINQFPKFPPALHNIAICYTELKKFEVAENFYLKCMNIEPVSILTINNLAKLYYSKKQYSKALPVLRKSLLKKNDQEDIVEVTAVCLFESRLKKETNDFCFEALKKFPKNKILRIHYGKNLLRSNNHSEGLKHLKESTGMIEFGEKSFKIV
tara:strand:+ start:1612 stop:2166 length:555 start_codon:yes stop_codon:yes gene_type:complete